MKKTDDSGPLLGREKEMKYLTSFLLNFLKVQSAGEMLFVSGVPGTGKTATVRHCLSTLSPQLAQVIFVNGMEIYHPMNIYQEIYLQLYPTKKKCPPSSQCLTLLDRLFRRKQRSKEAFQASCSRVLVIDEVDHLLTRDQKIIYSLLEWPNLPTARLCLIAISNTMNLPDFLHARCSSRLGSNRLDFHAYTTCQIYAILETKLKTFCPDCVFHNVALDFCARKVSGYSGDIRRAFHICQRAAEWTKHHDPSNPVSMKAIKAAEDDLYQQPEFAYIQKLPLLSKLLLTAFVLYLKETQENQNRSILTVHDLARRFETLVCACSFGHLISVAKPAPFASLLIVKKLLASLQLFSLVELCPNQPYVFHTAQETATQIINSRANQDPSSPKKQVLLKKMCNPIIDELGEDVCPQLLIDMDLVVTALSRDPICSKKLLADQSRLAC